MNCASCNADNDPQELSCLECGKSLARSEEDLQKVDPKSTALLGYIIGGIGFVTLFFVTINLEALTLSSQDYLIPLLLTAMGAGIVYYARTLRK